MLGFEVSSRKVSSEFRHFIEDNALNVRNLDV